MTITWDQNPFAPCIHGRVNGKAIAGISYIKGVKGWLYGEQVFYSIGDDYDEEILAAKKYIQGQFEKSTAVEFASFTK